MNFLKTSEGGWVISDPRNYVADFSVLNKHFSLQNFRKRGEVAPIRKIWVEGLKNSVTETFHSE